MFNERDVGIVEEMLCGFKRVQTGCIKICEGHENHFLKSVIKLNVSRPTKVSYYVLYL